MREAGILLPIFSLPSKYGIGCFDIEAYRFIDQLKDANQSVWQILPLGMTSYGDSPYQSFSTFAGNPYFISLDALKDKGYLKQEELPEADVNEREIDYGYLYQTRYAVLRKAFSRFSPTEKYLRWVKKNTWWLKDFTLYLTIKWQYDGASWDEWPNELRNRDKKVLSEIEEKWKEEMEFFSFLQYEFWRQWYALKNYANSKGIRIIGDIPIYVAYDSADVWSHRELFQLDETGIPTSVAGVPPDGFSATGQLWGNPLYDWKAHKETDYDWWIQRMRAALSAYDTVRIDHFRGFDEYYSIPRGEKTGKNGKWEKGPGAAIFKYMEKKIGTMSVIAEDLGYLTDSVVTMLEECGYPGMKILEFAFDSRDSSSSNQYLPHVYTNNCVAYTGTHDNETMMGWFSSITEEEKSNLKDYLMIETDDTNEWLIQCIRVLMASQADLCILPIQDWLHLDNTARVNTPSTLGGNWKWRLKRDEIKPALIENMAKMANRFGRQGTTGDQKDMELRVQLNNILQIREQKSLKDCSAQEIYTGLLVLTKALMSEKKNTQSGRKLYYISAEFLVGKLLSNNLINLGIYQEIKDILAENDIRLSDIEEIECEPSLGNGGLGRLAACFMDSLATLGLSGEGIGLNYHYGLFEQHFKDHKQYETKNPWLQEPSWLTDTGISFKTTFGKGTVVSKLYDMAVSGYDSQVNQLHLFDLETVDDGLVEEGIHFDLSAVDKNLTLFLYPDDSTEQGKKLRIYQQYFMVSNAAQYILMEQKKWGHDLHKLHEYVCIQINDTHPSMIIPELIDRLMKEGIHMEEAIHIVSETCAYTNHTILAEALEKWPYQDLQEVIPHLMPIIEALAMKAPKKEGTEIIDSKDLVHMARMDIHYGYSVNGVAALHTEILKNSELKPFNELYPEKFNNKTNGITFRRWLLYANPDLAQWIESKIGSEFKKDAEALEDLLSYNHSESWRQLAKIKQNNKEKLAEYLKETQDIVLDTNSIFDIQIKRLHEYKRQQMNVLFIIWMMQEIRKGNVPPHRITFIFGAKAAPAYVLAKDIIHAILCIQDIISKDSVLMKYIQVIMVENYNVTKAEKLIPAADISEQISLASKEASGTGNMKLMLNGAVTLGTMDGANVEISELVGEDNIYIFGRSSQEVIAHYEKADYHPQEHITPRIKEILDYLISDEMIQIGDPECLQRLHDDICQKDWFMALLDLSDYISVKSQMIKDYTNREKWQRMSLINIAKAGFFSSDRTIKQYNKDIWKL